MTRQFVLAFFQRLRSSPRLLAALAFAYLAVFLLLDVSRDGDVIWVYYPRAALVHGTSFGNMYRGDDVEYPPVAMYLIVGTGWLARQLPDVGENLDVLSIFQLAPEMRMFKLVFRLEMFLAAVAIFGLLFQRLREANPHEGLAERRGRLLFFVAGLFFLRYLIFDRLDVLVGLVLLASLELLNAGRRQAAIGLLAVGAAYKLVPGLLLPLWLLRIGLEDRLTGSRWTVLRRQLAYLALFGGIVLALLAPAYLAGGERSLLFWSYHRQRGIEVYSTWACAGRRAEGFARATHHASPSLRLGRRGVVGHAAADSARHDPDARWLAGACGLGVALRPTCGGRGGPLARLATPHGCGGVVVLVREQGLFTAIPTLAAPALPAGATRGQPPALVLRQHSRGVPVDRNAVPAFAPTHVRPTRSAPRRRPDHVGEHFDRATRGCVAGGVCFVRARPPRACASFSINCQYASPSI